MQRIEHLRLVPPPVPVPASYELLRWAKRVLRKGSPRLMKILEGQFTLFGAPVRPPDRA